MPLSSHPTKNFIDRDSSLDMIPNGALKESFATNVQVLIVKTTFSNDNFTNGQVLCSSDLEEMYTQLKMAF
jgi:hypothetical protein